MPNCHFPLSLCFLCGFWGLNLSPQACAISTLWTDTQLWNVPVSSDVVAGTLGRGFTEVVVGCIWGERVRGGTLAWLAELVMRASQGDLWLRDKGVQGYRMGGKAPLSIGPCWLTQPWLRNADFSFRTLSLSTFGGLLHRHKWLIINLPCKINMHFLSRILRVGHEFNPYCSTAGRRLLVSAIQVYTIQAPSMPFFPWPLNLGCGAGRDLCPVT